MDITEPIPTETEPTHEEQAPEEEQAAPPTFQEELIGLLTRIAAALEGIGEEFALSNQAK